RIAVEDRAFAAFFVVDDELHGDAASENLLSEIVGAAAWPGQRNLKMESIYEYGSRAGFWRLWRMFTDLTVQATVYGVTLAMARNPE
ncbi:allantoinase, partial [Rhizobium ruizarguesonis]